MTFAAIEPILGLHQAIQNRFTDMRTHMAGGGGCGGGGLRRRLRGATQLDAGRLATSLGAHATANAPPTPAAVPMPSVTVGATIGRNRQSQLVLQLLAQPASPRAVQREQDVGKPRDGRIGPFRNIRIGS